MNSTIESTSTAVSTMCPMSVAAICEPLACIGEKSCVTSPTTA